MTLTLPADATQEFLPDEHVIRRDLLGIAIGHTYSAVVGNAAVGLLTAVLLGRMLDGKALAMSLWMLGLAALLVVRLIHFSKIRARVPELDASGLVQAEWQTSVFIGLCGLAWGILPLISFSGAYGFTDFYTLATLLGMSSGAVNSTLALPRALRAYLLCLGVPFFVLRAFYLGGGGDLAGGLTVILTIIFLWALGRSSYATLRTNLIMTHQNRKFSEALAFERDTLRSTMQAKDMFHAGVTHDLRQPVHAIALHLRYLRKLADKEFDRQMLDDNCTAMETALHAMSRQLTRLLDLSRLESGEIKPHHSSFTLDEILQESRHKFAAVAGDKGLEFRIRARSLNVSSNKQMLQSIVDNLVSNAIRYTRSGGVLLAVHSRGDQVEVRVYDTGPGIEPEIVPQLFVAYRRFDDRRLGSEEGHGLGLAIVSKQADVLGHALRVSTTPGRGSLFAISVPLAQ
jgi:signal transduction histidine kinase